MIHHLWHFRRLVLFFFLIPFQAYSQLHDVMQRDRLKALGIDSIEKTEILLDSFEQPIKESMIEKIMVNSQGYLIKIEALDESGKCKSERENDYQDTFLIESRYFVRCADWGSVMTVKYQYDKKKRLESYSFFSKIGKTTTVSHVYDASGQLLIKKQRFHPNKLTKSNGGKEIWKYIYASNGQLIRIDVISGSGKKAQKKFYTYKYDTQNRRIETYVTKQGDTKGFLTEKRGYDPDGKLAYADICFSSAISSYSGLLKVKIPAGGCKNTNYVYDSNGLIQEEWISVDHQLKSIIRYKYY